MFFNGWYGILRVLISTVVGYFAVLAILRISGKRTLAKMNAFDFAVTIALGSTLSSIMLERTVPVLEGVAAVACLVGLQWTVAFLSMRSPAWKRIIKSEPRLMVHRGVFLPSAMWSERTTEDEIRAALRHRGLPCVEEAEAIVLETDGTLSVIPAGTREVGSEVAVLTNVAGVPRPDGRAPDHS